MIEIERHHIIQNPDYTACNNEITKDFKTLLWLELFLITYCNVMKLVAMRDSIPSQMKSNLGCVREKLICGVVIKIDHLYNLQQLWVRIPPLQQKLFISGCSSVDRMRELGSCGRRFESFHPDEKKIFKKIKFCSFFDIL